MAYKVNAAAESEEPIVVLDDADFSALDEPPMALGRAARSYLHSQGLIDPATWAAFRLDAADDATLARLGITGRRRPTGVGLSIPTWLPSDPSTFVGLIRVVPAQNKHRFITSPLGIAGPVEVASASRIILADSPLLAMRLHQAGARDVALIEEVAALPALAAWISGRDIILASHHASDLAALRAALGERGASVPGVLVSMAKGMFSPEVRDLLGITEVAERPVPPITPLLLTEIHAYARGRLDAGEAHRALAAVGLDQPDLIAAYSVGYLPADYRHALSREAQRALVGNRCGNSLMFPAFDEAGTIVDALVLRTQATVHIVDSFFQDPRGVLAPETAQGHTDLIVTDSVPWLARLFRQGYRNVLLVRGVGDAQRHVRRMVAAGVERITVRARRSAERLAGVFQSAGLNVSITRAPVEDDQFSGSTAPVAETVSPQPSAPKLPLYIGTQAAPESAPEYVPPAPALAAPIIADPSGLIFVEEDRTNEVVIFQAGPVRYAVELREDGETKRQVTIRSNGQSCQDRFDLANEHQRQRCAGNVARRIGCTAATIAAHLAAMLSAVQAREDAHEQGPVAQLSPEERKAGLALLESPHLLDLVAADLGGLGWIGEERAKHLLYLAAISRLLPQPVWAVYQASAGTAPWQGLGCIAALTPPEAMTVFHRITDAAIAHADRASLRHRLLVVDQAETLRPEAALALRVLHERGGVGWATASSGMASALGEARGPVAVLAAAAGALDHRCRDDFLTVTVDESPEQTAAIMSDQRRRLTAGASPADHRAIVSRHHAAQRMIERLPVRIPFADRIVFPASRLRHRSEQAWFLGLIAASALLHQRQRQRHDGAVIASEADFDIVVGCTVGMLGVEAESISGPSRQLLTKLYEHKLASFTMADLSGVLPDWTRYAFRAALQDLMDFGHVESPEGVRGRLRSFRLVVRAGGPALPSGIRLRRTDAVGTEGAAAAESVRVGELATVGDPGIANFTRIKTGT